MNKFNLCKRLLYLYVESIPKVVQMSSQNGRLRMVNVAGAGLRNRWCDDLDVFSEDWIELALDRKMLMAMRLFFVQDWVKMKRTRSTLIL